MISYSGMHKNAAHSYTKDTESTKSNFLRKMYSVLLQRLLQALVVSSAPSPLIISLMHRDVRELCQLNIWKIGRWILVWRTLLAGGIGPALRRTVLGRIERTLRISKLWKVFLIADIHTEKKLLNKTIYRRKWLGLVHPFTQSYYFNWRRHARGHQHAQKTLQRGCRWYIYSQRSLYLAIGFGSWIESYAGRCEVTGRPCEGTAS